MDHWLLNPAWGTLAGSILLAGGVVYLAIYRVGQNEKAIRELQAKVDRLDPNLSRRLEETCDEMREVDQILRTRSHSFRNWVTWAESILDDVWAATHERRMPPAPRLNGYNGEKR